MPYRPLVFLKKESFIGIFLSIFLVLSIIFTTQGLTKGFIYETNDDYGILYTTLYAKYPCVYYTSAIYSAILINLPKYLGLFDWHGLILLISNILSYSLLFSMILYLYKQQLLIIVCLISLCLLYPFNFFYLQYTSSSILLACASYISIYYFIRFNKFSLFKLIPLCILLVASFILRKDAFFLTTALCLPALTLYSLYHKKWHVPLIIGLLSLSLMNVENTLMECNCNKASLGWHRFRGTVTDGYINSEDVNQKVIDTLGISKNDLLMLRGFFMEDSLLSNFKNYQTISNIISHKTKDSFFNRLKVACHNLLATLVYSFYFYFFILLVSFAILLNLSTVDKTSLIVLALFGLIYVLFCIYLNLYVKTVPDRIHRPLLLCMGLFSLVFFKQNNAVIPYNLTKSLYALLFIGFIIETPITYKWYKNKAVVISQLFLDIPDMYKENFIYLYPPRLIKAFDNWTIIKKTRYKSSVGVMNHEPSFNATKAAYFGKDTKFLNIALSDSTLHIVEKSPFNVFYHQYLKTYIEERTGKKCTIDTLKISNNNYDYLKLSVE
jgi:hypothetical protein